MLVILTFIEKNNGIQKDYLERVKAACAEKSASYLEKPVEDVYLFAESLIDQIMI